jgi:predicted AlkP superfamily phosphohydrolase/phosphomutase
MGTRLAKKVLVIGWDAADWKVAEPLMAQGRMPNLKRMVDGGVRGSIRTLVPRLSPLLWTSVVTGKRADKHGILNFVEPDPEGSGIRLSTSTTRRTKALWNILTQSGLRTNVVSWYASHPAEPIGGICVSNLFQQGAPDSSKTPWPMQPAAVQPSAWTDKVAAARVHPADLAARTLEAMVPRLARIGRDDPRIKTLTQHVAQCTNRFM